MSTNSQRSFSGGEISPSLYARTDVNKYYTSVKKMRNLYSMIHGGAENRPGTEFIHEVKDSTKDVRLIPFVFSRSVTYVLEFGDEYMRVIKDGVIQKRTAQNITTISNASTGVLTYSGADNYANGDQVYISGLAGTLGNNLNGRTFKVANVNTGLNTFELNYLNGTAVNTTAMGSYTSGGTIEEIYEISTPYQDTEIADLKFAQSGDVLYIVHPNYTTRVLSRTGDISWTLSSVTFFPEVNGASVTGLGITPQGTTGSTTYTYLVTTFDPRTGEESVGTSNSTTTGNATLSSTNFNRITFTSLGDPYEHNIYLLRAGIWGFVGTCSGTVAQFDDIGYTPDYTDNPPTDRAVFDAANDYPSAITFYQQRLALANTNNNPEKIWLSGTGSFTNFQVNKPIQDSDSIEFTLAGKLISQVYHLVDIGRLAVFTESGEWIVNGDDAGGIVPTRINATQSTYYGSDPQLTPIVIGNSAIYVQARGSIVRDFSYKIESNGYDGNNLSLFSSHLFKNYTISDWAFQQVPNSILWAVRSDGKLLGLTYLKEQQVLAWHQHDTEGGVFENVCTIPGTTEDEVYFVVQRVINGSTVKYIEKMVTRQIDQIEDVKIIDCHLSYDGRNTGSQSMTLSEYLSGGWDYTSTVNITSSTSYFSSTEVGNEIHLTGADGTIIRLELTEYVSGTVMRGRPNKTVPAGMRSVAITDWSRAVDTIRGLWHLEGETVSVFADGFVVANPNNSSYTTVTVSSGSITLDDCYGVIHIGIPITADLETLNIDNPNGETISDKKQIINKLSLFVEASRGIWAGSEEPDETVGFLDGLNEYKLRGFESYDEPVELKTEVVEVDLQSHWNSNGRVFIRQTDPVPLTILAVLPAGKFPIRGG
jgi:hypothetical protein